MIKKNKWWLILIYCLCGILVATAITLSIVKTNYAPDVAKPIMINIEGSDKPFPGGSTSNEEDKKVYDKVMTNYNRAFTESVMSGFFSGRTSFRSRIEECTGSNKDPIKKLTGYKVIFTFSESQTLMLNGKIYNPPTNSNTTVKYSRMIFNVVEGEKMQSHDIYFESRENDSTTPIYYKQTVMCNFNDLYETISNWA